MSTFFNHKNSFLLGTAAGAAAYSVTLYTSPALIYATNFVVGSALISLLGPVAAATMGWALPFIAVLAMGGLAAWLMSSLINMFNAEKQAEIKNDVNLNNNDVVQQDMQEHQQEENNNNDIDNNNNNNDDVVEERSRANSMNP